MNPWIFILLLAAGVVFGLDYLLRRKAWHNNSEEEKKSLLVNMFSAGAYVFLSAVGVLWGIVPGSPETALGETLYDTTLMMGGIYFIVAIAAVILSFVFRKIGKTKASIWSNVIAFMYIAVVLVVNCLAGEIL